MLQPLIGHLYEVVSLDSDWYILNDFTKTYQARHGSIQSDDYLNFERGDFVNTKRFHTWNNQPPYIGSVKKKANLKKPFLRSSMIREFQVSEDYPSFLEDLYPV